MGRKRKTDNLKAIAYLRKSTDKQENSFDVQRHEIEQYAASNGIKILQFFEESASGCAPLDKRPILLDAMKAAETERAGVFITSKSDRISRSETTAILIADQLQRKNVAFRTADGLSDSEKPEMRFLAQTLRNVAELERGFISQRTRATLQKLKREGKRAGQIPYGYATDPEDPARLIKHPDEQQNILRIRSERSMGHTYAHICNTLTAEGVAPRGAKWHQNTVRRILLAA